ncbi:MAG: hypothetical protein AAB365_02215 [Patescibacteria group bacterium]
MKYGNRSLAKRIIASPLTMIAAAVLVVILAKAGWNIYGKTRLTSERLGQAQAEITKLRDRQATLAARVGYLSTEQGIETEIRTKYHAVKEGESVAVIIDESKTAAVVNAEPVQATSSVGWFRKLLQKVGFWR